MNKELIIGMPPQKVGKPLHHCPGCHYGIIFRIITECIQELGIEDRTIAVGGGGCTGRWATYFSVDACGGTHGPGPAIATGIKRIRPESIVFLMQGDGEQGAIGLGYFMAAALRGEKITIIGLNNACYGTTGGQMAPTTLVGMKTSTTPYGRNPANDGYPFHAAEIAAAIKGTAYSARVSVHTPANRQKAKKALKTAFEKQINGVGLSMVEFLTPCPPNWHLDPIKCLDFIENEMIKEFPLGEYKNVDSIE